MTEGGKNSSNRHRHRLAKWLRQSGYDPDDDLQVVDEPADGRISISVILPVLDRETGEPITGQASANNRKEAERLAALDTCRQLDRLGLWNAAAAAGKRAKRQRKLRNVGYDEDEDDLFYDETAKRTERETNAPISSKTAIGKSETHESLLVKHKHLEQTIQDKESEMAVVLSKQVAGGNADDELEAFMGALDSELKEKQIAAMQVEITAMRRELQRLEQLIEFTKPLTITTGTAGRSEPIKVATSETPVESPVAAAKKSQPRTEFIKHLSPQMPSPSPPKQETAISSSNKTTVKGPTSMPTNWNQSTTVVEADDQIVDWVPPATQSGDGSTALNERLGY
jgi:hypothetical protein